jgi:UDP-2-acetamido-3-amino-2,3-dideoxy-glucuronate N-acetyltransferase
MNYFAIMDNHPAYIHPSSIVEPGAMIGNGTRVWHFCHIMPSAIIGENCILGQNVYVDNNVSIGNAVKIQNNVSVYNGVILEDEVFVGPSAVFTNVINPRSFIERKKEFRSTLVRRGASIGANATIICGIEIGEYAFIGAGAVVTKSVPAFALMLGNPARLNSWVSKAGGKLDFKGSDTAICPISGEEYKLYGNSITTVK